MSVHIEKTGGTSLKEILETVYGGDRLLIYIPSEQIFFPYSRDVIPSNHGIVELMKRTFADNKILFAFFSSAYTQLSRKRRLKNGYKQSEIPEEFYAFHGHCFVEDIPIGVIPALLITVVRDPLARIWSQYKHWNIRKGRVDWWVDIPWDEGISFAEFAFLTDLQNFQYKAITGQGISADEFDLIGNTNNLWLFVQSLLILAREKGLPVIEGIDEIAVPRKNASHDGMNRPPIDEKKFKLFHDLDYQLVAESLN